MKKRILLIWLTMVLTLAAAGITPAAQTEKAKEGKNSESKDAKAATVERKSISGVVKDAKDQPLGGAEVVFIRIEALEFTGVQMNSAKTGADGKFTFDIPAGGMDPYHFVIASKPGHAWGGCMVDGETDTEGKPIDLALGEPKPLAGQVVNHKGEPVSGALVCPLVLTKQANADRMDMIFIWPGMEEFTAKTDAAGRFRFEQLPAGGKARVAVRHPDYANLVLPLGSETPGFDVGKEDVRVELTAAGTIQGRLVDAVTSRPVEGVTLEGVRNQESELPFVNVATTGADGRYEFRNLRPGDYTIDLPPLPPSSTFNGVVQRRSGVKLQEGQVLRGIDLLRKPGILVKGRVIEEKSGKGLPNATVQAYMTVSAFRPGRGGDIPAWHVSTDTDRDGHFKITAPEGSVTLQAVSSGYRAGSQPAQSLNLKSDETPAEVVIALKGNPALRISGVVLDPAGKPVAGVIVRPGFGNLRSGVRTGDDGKFEFKSTPHPYGGENLAIYALAPEKDLAAMVPVDRDKEEIVLKIQMKACAIVTGRVLDEGKKPLIKAKVQLQRMTRIGNGGAMTGTFGEPVLVDTEGRFRISELWRDGVEYSLNVSCEGYGAKQIQDIKGGAGQTIDCGDITLLEGSAAMIPMIPPPPEVRR